MKQHILIAVDDFDSSILKKISAAVSDWAVVKAIKQDSPEKKYRSALKSSDICIGWPKAEWLFDTGIRFLQTGSSGWEQYKGKGLELIDNFSLCTARGIYTTGAAEHAIAMMLALVRRIPAHVHDKDQKKFRRHLPYAAEINGSVACIVGMGEIGKEIAGRCKGLGMAVIGVIRSTKAGIEKLVDKVFDVSEMKTAISKADHIFLAIPGTGENAGLLSREMLLSCKKSAFLYNISRGNILDEAVLYEFIRDKRIAGAGLDVTAVEPLPVRSKLWKLGDNVLITGHSAGLSAGHTSRFQQ
ncbi:MAG TPA: NAD(P)-dependent oxidoreductase, partial [Puia sp.]|nr:NAD(P)-dependent oxidoreductase [Puia sp.]